MVYMITKFKEMLSEIGISISEQQEQQFERYYELLIEWNDKINLTAITEKEDVYIKHFYDSLCLIKAVKMDKQSILDVGSGAGFPSIPLKIIFPSISVTIIDALAKRINFLSILTSELGLDVTLIHGRAEEFGNRESYDIVTARAVANLRVLSELCIPFVRLNGYFIALKGPKHNSEIDESLFAITELGGTLQDVQLYQIENQDRSLVIISKVKTTKKKYPRMFSKIKKNPL